MWRSFGRRRQAAVEIGGAAGVAGGFDKVAESAPGLGEDLAGVALGPGVLAGLGDLERGLGVVAGGDGVAAGEGDAGAEDQAIGVDEAVIARSGKVERALAGGESGVEAVRAEFITDINSFVTVRAVGTLIPRAAARLLLLEPGRRFPKLRRFRHGIEFPFGKPQPSDPTRPITNISSAWNALRKAAGVQCRLRDLRHTAATKMAEAGVPESTMLALMGT